LDLLIADRQILDLREKEFIDELHRIAPRVKTILLIPENKGSSKKETKLFDRIIHKPVKHSTLFTSIFDLFSHPETIASNENSANGKEKNKENSIKKVLLVEDNLINQKIAEKMLARLGCVSVIANNGQEAINFLMENANQFDFVLMDVQMPVLNGLDATKAIRSKGLNIPIIAMTANVLKGDREICLESGMNDYIGKPVTINDLSNVMQKWI